MALYLAAPSVWSLILLILGSLLPATTMARNSKRGIASAPGAYQASDLMKAGAGQASWVYNWNDYPPSSVPNGIEYVPMQWGEDNIGNLHDRIKSTNAKVLLVSLVENFLYSKLMVLKAFNEPDIPSQSNMSPQRAAQLWKQYIQPLKGQFNIRLGSPAVADARSSWLKDFMDACAGCTVDFLVIHWYVAVIFQEPGCSFGTQARPRSRKLHPTLGRYAQEIP